MAAKLMEILEILHNEYHLFAWVYGDMLGWMIRVQVLNGTNVCVHDYPVEPGIVSPYRTAADVAREIAEEVSSYGKS